jgi:flagellar secretion chaperone FliS
MNHAQNSYLETHIFTATPQKLRLMLIDGAIRFTTRAVEAFNAGELQEFNDLIARSRDIAAELLGAINPDGHAITNATRGIYGFVLLALAETQLEQNITKLSGVLRVLEEERITWMQVCELETEGPRQQMRLDGPEEIGAFQAAETLGMTATSSVSQFSLDA